MPEKPIGEIEMKPPHPGQFFQDEVLAELGLSITRAAEVLSVRRATLSDLVHGKTALSADMALRMEKAFGLSLDTMLRLQAWHDAEAIRERADEIDVKRYEPA